MPNARIEIEYIHNDTWVVQIEASSYMTAKRDMFRVATAEEAFEVALRRYLELAALVDPKARPEPVAEESKEVAPIEDGSADTPRGPIRVGDIACDECGARLFAKSGERLDSYIARAKANGWAIVDDGQEIYCPLHVEIATKSVEAEDTAEAVESVAEEATGTKDDAPDYTGRRGRHPTNCICAKCEAKRIAA